jgi:hypothetical protein
MELVSERACPRTTDCLFERPPCPRQAARALIGERVARRWSEEVGERKAPRRKGHATRSSLCEEGDDVASTCRERGAHAVRRRQRADAGCGHAEARIDRFAVGTLRCAMGCRQRAEGGLSCGPVPRERSRHRELERPDRRQKRRTRSKHSEQPEAAACRHETRHDPGHAGDPQTDPGDDEGLDQKLPAGLLQLPADGAKCCTKGQCQCRGDDESASAASRRKLVTVVRPTGDGRRRYVGQLPPS